MRCGAAARPLSMAWRLLEGAASEKGRQAELTRQLITQTLELGGPDCIAWLRADALDADGPLSPWLAYQKGERRADAVAGGPADVRRHAGPGPGRGAAMDTAPVRADDPRPPVWAFPLTIAHPLWWHEIEACP
jgi:hypothetical protein